MDKFLNFYSKYPWVAIVIVIQWLATAFVIIYSDVDVTNVMGTAFIVPNTIATIFGTPIGEHLEWHTMLLILILSTILSIVLAYWVVRKKKILPKKVH